jgi:hypothetical protein
MQDVVSAHVVDALKRLVQFSKGKVYRRYAPPRMSEAEIAVVISIPDHSKVCTSYVGATEFDPTNEDC